MYQHVGMCGHWSLRVPTSSRGLSVVRHKIWLLIMDTNPDNWHQVETYQSLMQYGSSTLRFVLLVNGGVAVGLLTFVGNTVTKSVISIDMKWSIIWFLCRIICGGLGNGTAYRSG